MILFRALISHRFYRAVRSIPIFFLLAFSVQLDANPPQTRQETQTPKERAIGRKLEEKGVPNFGEVTPTLYRRAAQ